MIRLILNFTAFWCTISLLIYLWAHASDQQHIDVTKAMLFGFVSAVVTGVTITAIIILF